MNIKYFKAQDDSDRSPGCRLQLRLHSETIPSRIQKLYIKAKIDAAHIQTLPESIFKTIRSRTKLRYSNTYWCLVIRATTWQNQQNDVRPAKTQISLGICSVWSVSSLCAQCVAKDPRFLHADSEDWSDWLDAQADLHLRWAPTHFVGFVMSRLICQQHLLTFKSSLRRILLSIEKLFSRLDLCTGWRIWLKPSSKTFFFNLFVSSFPLGDLAKECRPWSDAAEHGQHCLLLLLL